MECISKDTRHGASDGSAKMSYSTQIFGAFVICLANLNMGALIAYPAIALPQWKNGTSHEISLDDNEGSLFASLFWMVGVICSPIGGFLSGWLGRKRIMIVTTPLVACGWLLLGLAQNKPMLYTGRIISSIAVLSQSSSIYTYISETVHPKVRGSLITMPSFMMAFGLLLVWFLGYFLSWRIIAYILTIPPILLIMLLLLLPETPYWLIEYNNVEEAKKSLQFFRGKNYNITEELNEMQQRHEVKKRESSSQTWKFVIKRIFSRAFLKPFSCIGILSIINTWGGFSQIQVFTIEILEKSGSSIDPWLGPMIAGFIRMAFAGMAPFFMKRFQPKLLFVFTTFFTSMAMVLIGIFVYLQKYYPDLSYLQEFSWMPLAILVVPSIMKAIGILPVQHSLLSEVFPTEIRTQAIGLVQATEWGSGALSVTVFPQMSNFLSFHGLFFLYGAAGIINCLWALKTIPDNRGKSLTKVEEMYEKKSDGNDHERQTNELNIRNNLDRGQVNHGMTEEPKK